MKIIDQILRRPEFVKKPPVLMDIGASGKVPAEWKVLAKYSVGISFDPDSRDMKYIENEKNNFKFLKVFPFAIVPKRQKEIKFYLTKAPYCSSTLCPDKKQLDEWDFSDLFSVTGTKKVQTITAKKALSQEKIDYVDWFKTDSQGTDLRLMLSLPKDVIKKVLAVQLEPGILDAYIGEDKLWQIFAEMEKRSFWMSEMDLRGTKRISSKILSNIDKESIRKLQLTTPVSPGWAEVLYFNKMNSDSMEMRDFLLMWVFAMIKKQYGFAVEIAILGKKRFRNTIFDRLIEETILESKRKYIYSWIINIIKFGIDVIKERID